jgi:hypothetical protein
MHLQVSETMSGLRQQLQEPNTQQHLFPPLEVSVTLPAMLLLV